MAATLAAVAQRLRRIRAERGLLLADVAAMSGLSEAHLYRIELGERCPSLQTLLVLADAYGISPSALLMVPTHGDEVIHHDAHAIWKGAGDAGTGVIRLEQAQVAYNLDSRMTSSSERRERHGGNLGSPEELVGAALTACYAMSLSQQLTTAGWKPRRVEIGARIARGTLDGQRSIIAIHLDAVVDVDDLDEGRLQEIALLTRRSCVIARALTTVPIAVGARLVSRRRAGRTRSA